MAVRRMVFAVALAGLAMAKPIKIKPTPTFCPIICIDAISDCGVPYGGYGSFFFFIVITWFDLVLT